MRRSAGGRWASWPSGRPAACWARSRWSSPGGSRPRPWTPPRPRREVAAREAAGTPRKEAIAAVAAESGLPRREVYNAVVAARLPYRGPSRPVSQAVAAVGPGRRGRAWAAAAAGPGYRAWSGRGGRRAHIPGGGETNLLLVTIAGRIAGTYQLVKTGNRRVPGQPGWR